MRFFRGKSAGSQCRFGRARIGGREVIMKTHVDIEAV